MYQNNQENNNGRKRKPSNWQLFLKGCIPDQPKELGMGQKVSACGTQYRELKEKDPKRLESMIETIKARPSKQQYGGE